MRGQLSIAAGEQVEATRVQHSWASGLDPCSCESFLEGYFFFFLKINQKMTSGI